MRFRPIYFLLLAVTLLAALVYWLRHEIPEGRPGDAFWIVEERASLPEGHYLEDHVSRVWEVDVDLQKLRRNPPQIQYSLPDGKRYLRERLGTEHIDDREFVWFGSDVWLRIGEDSIGGVIYGKTRRRYRLLEGESDGNYHLLEVDGRSYPSDSFDAVAPAT